MTHQLRINYERFGMLPRHPAPAVMREVAEEAEKRRGPRETWDGLPFRGPVLTIAEDGTAAIERRQTVIVRAHSLPTLERDPE